MNIKNAKLIVLNPPGLEIFENFGIDIICTHETPNTHATTKLWRRKNDKLILIKTDNPNGLEDANEVRRGDDRLMACEVKMIGGNQDDIGIFKTTDGINYHQTDTFIPTTGWQKDSVSSPTFYDNGLPNVPMLYEGRYRENWDDFKTGLAYVNFATGKIVSRQSNPISNDRLVPDDIWFKNGWYWYSMHSRNDTLGWYAKLYKSKVFGQDLIFDSNITYKGETIIAYYNKDRSFYWNNQAGGMYQEVKETNNGGNVNQIAKIDGLVLSAATVSNAVSYQWQYVKDNGSSEWFKAGQTFTIPTGHRKDGRGFFFYAKFADGSRVLGNSNTVIFGEVIEPPIIPPDEIDIPKIREHAQAILDLTE